MSIVTMHRVVYPQTHVFHDERVGWSGVGFVGESKVYIDITFQAGVNRFLVQVTTDTYTKTFWGTPEQVVEYAMISCSGDGLFFPKDNLMNQYVERVIMERFNRSESEEVND